MLVPYDRVNSSDGRMVRASTSGAVHFGSIRSWAKLVSVKLVFTASLLDAQRWRQCGEQAGKFTCVVGKGT